MRCEIQTRVKTKNGEIARSYFVKANNPTEARCKFEGRLAKGWRPKGVKSVFVKNAQVAYPKGRNLTQMSLVGSL